jgi:hypothetical protein
MPTFMSGPGSLEGSYNDGRKNFENRGKFNSEMASENLLRQLKMAEEARKVQEQPLKMQGLEAGVAQTKAQTAQAEQQTLTSKDTNQRAMEKHELDQAEEQGKQYGAIGAELEMLPPNMRLPYFKERTKGTAAGRKMYENIAYGIEQGQTNELELPEGLRHMQEQIIKNSREYRQAMDVGKLNADQRLATGQASADARVTAAEARASATVAAADRRATQITHNQAEKFANQADRDARLHKQNMEKIERQGQLRLDAQKAKGSTAKGPAAIKNFEQLSAMLEIEARGEKDPIKKAELQQEADDMYQRAATLKAAGRPASDEVLGKNPVTGKPAVVTESRIPGTPPRSGGKPASEEPKPTGDAKPESKYKSKYGLE